MHFVYMGRIILTVRSLLFTENENNIKKQTRRDRYEGDDHSWYCILSFNPHYRLLFQLSCTEPFTFFCLLYLSGVVLILGLMWIAPVYQCLLKIDKSSLEYVSKPMIISDSQNTFNKLNRPKVKYNLH